MLKVVHDTETVNENTTGESLLDAIARDGARQMLPVALQAEIDAYIDAHRGEVDENGHRLVVRNGYHEPRRVTTAAGAVQVHQPRVNDKRTDDTTGSVEGSPSHRVDLRDGEGAAARHQGPPLPRCRGGDGVQGH